MKIIELIQRIQSLYSKGVQSDDTRLSNRHIYNKMLSARALLIYNKIQKKQKLNQFNFQTLPCVELIEAMSHECPCLPPIGCKILRSKYKLPKPLGLNGDYIFQYVTTIDGQTVFAETTWTTKKFKEGNKYTSHQLDYYINNNFLYITVNTGIRVITLSGVFENPVEVSNYPSYCEDKIDDCTDCDNCSSPLEEEFPIDDDLIEDLIRLAIEELVILFSKNIEDLSNDTKDNLPQNSK